MSAVDQRRLHGTTDATVWAEEFAKVCPDVDRATMIGWFANAIEVGRSAGLRAPRPTGGCVVREL